MFGRLVTAMVTPFTEDLSVDFSGLSPLIEHLIDTGTTAIVVSGTTGESPTLSHEEKLRLFAECVTLCGGRIPVIAGTGGYNTQEVCAFTREVDALGVDAFLQVAPYYNKPSQEGLYQHFARVADVTSKPLLIYNIPGRTGVNVEVDTMVRLAQIPNVIGVKESSGDFTQISRMIAETPDDFMLYSGDDKFTLPVLALGGVGVISVASHVAGDMMNNMIEAFLAHDTVTARQWHHELMPLFEELFRTSNPVLVKAALNMLEISVGGVRLPLVAPTPEQLRSLRKVLSRYAQLEPLH